MRHVDIVRNEWLGGLQHVVARAVIEEGLFRIDSDEKVWEDALNRPLLDPENGLQIYALKDPDRFLNLLPRVVQGSYVFATEPHDVGACPYDSPVPPRLQRAERQFS